MSYSRSADLFPPFFLVTINSKKVYCWRHSLCMYLKLSSLWILGKKLKSKCHSASREAALLPMVSVTHSQLLIDVIKEITEGNFFIIHGYYNVRHFYGERTFMSLFFPQTNKWTKFETLLIFVSVLYFFTFHVLLELHLPLTILMKIEHLFHCTYFFLTQTVFHTAIVVVA